VRGTKDPLAAGKVTRPWDQQGSARSESSPSVDMFGRPLWVDSDKAIVDAVQQIAEARGVAMATVATAWMLRNPVVDAPLVGATKPHHLTSAVDALELELTGDEVRALEEHYTPREPTYF
jgi:aryl-alcohol dehydrogenase-like predicted oxidoreductase